MLSMPYNIYYEDHVHDPSTVCVLLITCIIDKTNTKETHTIKNLYPISSKKN